MTPNKLKSIRKKLFLSQWDLAIRLGVSQSSVTIWESGYRSIPEDIKIEVERLDKEMNKIMETV